MGEPDNRQGQQASKDREGPGVTKSPEEGCRSGQGEQAEIAQRERSEAQKASHQACPEEGGPFVLQILSRNCYSTSTY